MSEPLFLLVDEITARAVRAVSSNPIFLAQLGLVLVVSNKVFLKVGSVKDDFTNRTHVNLPLVHVCHEQTDKDLHTDRFLSP